MILKHVLKVGEQMDNENITKQVINKQNSIAKTSDFILKGITHKM